MAHGSRLAKSQIMSKTKVRSISIILVSQAAMILFFQNCSDFSAGDSGSAAVSPIVVNQTPLVAKDAIPTGFLPLLADRYLVTSVLTNAFGLTATTVDSSKTSINSADFGSSCSPYEDYNVMVGAVIQRADPMSACVKASFQTLDLGTSYPFGLVNPHGTTTREAQLAHACSDLTTNPTTLAFALAKISTDAVPAASDANIQTLFQLFYVNHPPPAADLIGSIQQVFLATPTLDQWRTAVFSVCASSYWQIL